MTKKNVIAAAYEAQYEKLKDTIDENGWCRGECDDNWHCSDIDHALIGTMVWRPQSLKGLETNNGWTKIESENDLPTCAGRYRCVYLKSDLMLETNWSSFKTETNIEAQRDYWIETYSHWQPIELIPPPLY